MNIGVQFYTLRDYIGSEAAFRYAVQHVHQMGYTCAELGTPSFMSPTAVRALMDEHGMRNLSAWGDFENLLDNPEAQAAVVLQAQAYGTERVCIGTLPSEWRESSDGFKRFAQGMNQIAKQIAQEGCKISYHPHALEFFSLGGGKTGMDILVEETDPVNVLFCLDTHWLASGGMQPDKWIRRLKGRVPVIHFKDYAIVGGASTIETVCKTFAEVGEGNLDWPAILSACRESGVQHAIVEQDVCKRDPYACLRTSRENLRKMGL